MGGVTLSAPAQRRNIREKFRLLGSKLHRVLTIAFLSVIISDENLDSFQSETLAAGREEEGRVSHPAKESQRQTSLPGHDGH